MDKEGYDHDPKALQCHNRLNRSPDRCGACQRPTRPGGRRRPNAGVEPDQIEYFIYVLDIDEINGQDQNFTVNVSLALRWDDPRLAHAGPAAIKLPLRDVWSPNIILANRQWNLRLSLPGIVEVEPNGHVTYRQQYVGPLSQKMDLRNFPLDTQDFTIHFIATDVAPDELEFVPWTVEHVGLVGGGMAEAEDLSLPDWTILNYETMPKGLTVADTHTVPGFAFTFVAKRHLAYYFWQAIVPLILIVMMSWVPFWVPPSQAELQFGIASSAVITLIAYRFTLTAMLPKLPYLTRLDYISTVGTILVFMAFLQVLITSLLGTGHKAPVAIKIDKTCRYLFPLVFAGIVYLALFWM